MEATRDIEPGRPDGTARGRVREWWSELVTENAMMDEATRYLRQFMRTGGDAGKGANLVILAILGLFYVWFLAMMVRYDFTATIPIEYAQLALVTLIAPTSIYAAISGEREKATWDALVLTRLTPAQIIAGKLAWRVLLVAAVMAILMVSIVVSQFTGSGYDRPEWTAVLTAQAMIFSWGVMLCAASLWVSAWTKQSVTTIALVIGSLLGGLILLPSLLAMFGISMEMTSASNPTHIIGNMVLWANPFLFLGEITGGGNRSYSDMPPSGDPFSWALFLIFVFSLAAAGFVYAAQKRIKRLEEPVRKT